MYCLFDKRNMSTKKLCKSYEHRRQYWIKMFCWYWQDCLQCSKLLLSMLLLLPCFCQHETVSLFLSAWNSDLLGQCGGGGCGGEGGVQMLLIRVHSLFFFLVAFLGLFSYFLSHLIHSHQRLYYLYLSSQRSKVTVCPCLWSCCTDKKRPHYVKKTHYFSIWSRLSVLSNHEMVRQSHFFSLLMKRLTNVSTKNAFFYVKK